MYILILSSEHPDLARAEVAALYPTAQCIRNIALVPHTRYISRLASVKSAYILLFQCTLAQLDKKIASFNWQQHYKKSFSVSYLDPKQRVSKERLLANRIYASLTKPKVSLTNPTTAFTFIQQKSTVYCGLPVYAAKTDYNKRLPHKQPAFKPISLKPRLARLLVNLTGATKTMYDPMCGIGGFLVEAGLIGLKPIGNDIDPYAIAATEKNLKKYNINAVLRIKDAFTCSRKRSHIIVDIPYGKNTAKTIWTVNDLLALINKTLTKRAVVAIPSTARYTIPRGLKLVGNYTYYIHKSLTKRILVLEK